VIRYLFVETGSLLLSRRVLISPISLHEIGHVEDFLLDDETCAIRHAIDGEIDHVDGILLDEETWAIRYVIVNTSNWWINHRVLIAPRWIRGAISAAETLTVDMTR
jgi:hypothetical protein